MHTGGACSQKFASAHTPSSRLAAQLCVLVFSPPCIMSMQGGTAPAPAARHQRPPSTRSPKPVPLADASTIHTLPLTPPQSVVQAPAAVAARAPKASTLRVPRNSQHAATTSSPRPAPRSHQRSNHTRSLFLRFLARHRHQSLRTRPLLRPLSHHQPARQRRQSLTLTFRLPSHTGWQPLTLASPPSQPTPHRVLLLLFAIGSSMVFPSHPTLIPPTPRAPTQALFALILVRPVNGLQRTWRAVQ